MINETIRKNINVDADNIFPIFTLKEGDNAKINVALFKNSVAFDVTGQTIKVGAKTSKGIVEQTTGITISKNNVDIQLKNSALKAGLVEIELEIKDTKGTMTTASFYVTVTPKVLNDDAIEATNEFDTLSKTVDKLEKDYSGLRKVIINENQAADLQDQINTVNTSLAHKMNKFDNFSVNQIDKNLGKLDQSYMSDEFLQQITGNTPINATPSDGSITREKYSLSSIYPEAISGKLQDILGVKYKHKILNQDDIVYNKDYVIVDEKGGITTNFPIPERYNWFHINNIFESYTFLHNGEDIYFVLAGSDTFCYAISFTDSHGSVYRFTNSSKTHSIARIEHYNNEPIPRGSEVSIISSGDYSYDIYIDSGILWGSINLRSYDVFNNESENILYSFGQLVYSKTYNKKLYDKSYLSSTSSITSKIDELDNNVKINTEDIIKTNDFIKEHIINFASINIIMTNENTTAGAYWGMSNASYNTTYDFYFATNDLIPVNSGSTLELKNWGETAPNFLAYSAYDNDGLPYNGSSARINFQDGVYNEDENTYTFIIPEGCTQIGLSIKYTSLCIKDDNMATIKDVEGEVGDALNNIIDKKIKSISTDLLEVEIDISSQMFNKGASKKTFDKKIAIITAGQSNTDGRVPFDNLPSYITLPIPNTHIATNYNGKVFKDGIQKSDYPNKWAFDLVTYYYLSQVANKEIYVMRYTMGGTSIDENGDNKYHWTPFYERLSGIDKSLLWQFEQLIRGCIAAKGNDFDIRAMLWHQGEGDRGVPENYYTNLKYLIAYCRGIVGNQRLPFICGTVPTTSSQFNQIIDDAIRKIANEDPYVYLVDMTGATLLDAYHFDANASEYFGKCVYDYMIDAGIISTDKLNPTKPW